VSTVPNKTEVITLRVTSGRKALYRDLAARDGFRLSEWLRRLADKRMAERLVTEGQ
jgi:hypothetical protein